MTKLRRVLIVVCIVVVLVCGAIIIKDQVDIHQAQSFDNSVKDLYRPSSRMGWFCLIPTAGAEMLPTDEEPEPPVQEDFMALLDTNPDTVAWVTAGERIDGPVMHADNEYYLTHNFYKQEDKQGAIFLNESCSIWPENTILLLHGHNMRNKGMFGTLASFGEYSYVKQYPIVRFRTIYDEQERLYVIYSAFHASMVQGDPHFFDLMEISFPSDEDYAHYLDISKRRSLWKSPVDVNTDDTLLSLVTCNYIDDDGRFILLCRRIR